VSARAGFGRARHTDEADVAAVAAIVHRLGVMLEAGTAPASAWVHAAATPDAPAVVITVARRIGDGVPVAPAILEAAARCPEAEARAWRSVAAVWTVAAESGAPIALALTSVAESLRDVDQVYRETAAALAAPESTARLVMVLPAVGLLFGAALGFDTFGVLIGNPIGWACLGVGALLLWAARRWNRGLIASARQSAVSPGLQLDLLAVSVSGGGAFDRSSASVESALTACGLSDALGTSAEATLDLSRRAGVPAAALLRAEAQQQRRQARSDGAKRAATLGVGLMLPLGLCVLPSFMVLGVIPLMVAVISGTLVA
jgi:tight adherence protein B